MKTPKNLLGLPKRASGKDLGYQKNQNMVATHQFAGQSPRVMRTKTDGRIGSATPPQFLKGGLTVDNNAKAGPSGGIGSQAAKHMSVGHEGGKAWSPRVAKARATAAAGRAAQHRPHTDPVNTRTPRLKHTRPD